MHNADLIPRYVTYFMNSGLIFKLIKNLREGPKNLKSVNQRRIESLLSTSGTRSGDLWLVPIRAKRQALWKQLFKLSCNVVKYRSIWRRFEIIKLCTDKSGVTIADSEVLHGSQMSHPTGLSLKLIDEAIDKQDKKDMHVSYWCGSGWLQWTKEVNIRLTDGNPRETL